MNGRGVLRAAVGLACACALMASLGAGPASAVPYEATRLENGLKIYSCVSERMCDYVAVRLVIFPPPCLPGSQKYLTYQTLMHSLFRDEDEAKDLFDHLYRTPSMTGLSVGYHRTVFSFDVPPAQLDSLLIRMVRQWETGLRQPQIDCGQSEMYDVDTGIFAPAIEQLVELTDDVWKDDFFAKSIDVAELFCSHMNARNMALIIAGSRANVDRATALARRFETVEPGEPSSAVAVGYGEAIHGRVIHLQYAPWAMGLRVNAPADGDPAVGYFYYAALLWKLNDILSLRKGLAYGLPGRFFMGPRERVMVFEACVDEDAVDYGELAEEAKRVAAGMADTSMMSWWTTYTESKQRNHERFWAELDDASKAARALTELVTYAHMEGREELGEYYLPTAEEARDGFARMLESGEWFVVASPYDWIDRLSDISESLIAFVYGDLFGPTDDKRALAVMCQCLLVLLVLRGLEKRMGRRKKQPAPEDPITPLETSATRRGVHSAPDASVTVPASPVMR